MKFILHCNDDQLSIEGDTIEEVREIAMKETISRGWNETDCWSEKVSD